MPVLYFLGFLLYTGFFTTFGSGLVNEIGAGVYFFGANEDGLYEEKYDFFSATLSFEGLPQDLL